MIVLAIPDLHLPFAHKDHLSFLRAVRDKYRPNKIVCLGDEADFHAISNFEHDPDGLSGGDEFDACMVGMRALYKLFPDCQVCVSNHTARPFRKAFSAGIPKAFMKSYAEFFQAPKGWSWHDEIEIDNVIYCHGEGSSGQAGALKRAQANMQSTVIGHLHAWAGIQYYANSKHLIFGFNVGCLLDRKAYAFAYGKHAPAKPILGVGIIKDGIPVFIPLKLRSDGRWSGHL